MENPWTINYKTFDVSNRIKANSATPAGFVVTKSEKFTKRKAPEQQQNKDENELRKLKVKVNINTL